PEYCVEEFSRHGITSIITTDDGSIGSLGFVTDALESFLHTNANKGQPFIIYTCGPEAMMRRVVEISSARGVASQVAVERAMACGMGTCQSCCIRVKVPRQLDPDGWRYKLACSDGPVFAGDDLLW